MWRSEVDMEYTGIARRGWMGSKATILCLWGLRSLLLSGGVLPLNKKINESVGLKKVQGEGCRSPKTVLESSWYVPQVSHPTSASSLSTLGFLPPLIGANLG